MHIQCGKCIRRNCSESTHCLAVKDQWDCVLNDFEELGDKIISCPDESQYSIEITSCCLRLLAFCSSTFHQTNAESSQNRSEDSLLISRIQSHHLLLAVIDHDEEECLVFLPQGTLDQIELLVQYQSIFFQEWVQSLKMSKQLRVFSVFASVLDWLAKANTFVFNKKSSDFVAEVSCSMSSYSLSIKSVTNLFNP